MRAPPSCALRGRRRTHDSLRIGHERRQARQRIERGHLIRVEGSQLLKQRMRGRGK
jgi:hypothetical protein